MTDKQTLKEAVYFLRDKIPLIEKRIKKLKEDIEWYKLTGEHKDGINFCYKLECTQKELDEKRELLEKNMKKYRALEKKEIKNVN